MKVNIHIIMCALLLAGFSACVEDESGWGGNAIPELSIAGDAEKMQVLNFNLGTECVICPDISYKGGVDENLTYTWSIGTYNNGVKGELEVVGHEKNLSYFFTQGGAYYAHLNVTDGVVGCVRDYQVNINRTFEEGYVLVSSDEADNGNIAFVKIMTPEEIETGVKQIYMEHCMEQMNEGVSEKGLRNVILGTVTWPTTIHRVMASVEDKCYFLDPNTFTVISEIDYTDVFPGFKASEFVYDEYIPYAYDANLKKFVHLDLQYMFGYEYKYYAGAAFDDFFMNTYSAWGRATVATLFANYEPAEVFEYDAYAPYYGLPDCFPSTLDMLAGEELLAAFMGEEMNPSTYYPPIYIITRSKTNPDILSLWTKDAASYIAPECFSKQECELTDDMALPKAGTAFVSSPTYHRFFYAVDNNVYVMLMENAFSLPNKSAAAIRFPDNEEVTYMSVNIDTEELYVATYDTTAKRGNFYIYDTADVRADNQTSPTPKEAHRNCADKISSILYKPRI